MTDNSIFENKKAAYFTLGCKLNFAETSTIGKALFDQGVRRAREGEVADICVVNTCSVTELADKKCRGIIRKIQKDHPGAFVVVTGCYAQLKPDEVSHIKGVNLVLGAEQKLDVVKYLQQIDSLKKDKHEVISSATKDIRTFQPGCSSDDRTRHFLKVQDGCDYHCTYCTIPKARGRSRNGTIDSLVQQARDVADSGGKEIVLTGVNIGDFGRTTGETFIDLIKALDDVEGIERYRISSIEPNLLSDKIIEFCASSKRFAPHFHIPLQSGSDEVLRLMKRRYDTDLFRRRIEHIKKVMPGAFIGVDVIVGTRGERPELFDECFEFLQSIPFSQLHVFSYSERPGTKALEIPYVVDTREKHRRSQRLLELSEQKLAVFYAAEINKPHKVLWENSEKEGYMTGFTENYVRVGKPFDANSIGRVETYIPREFSEDKTFLI